MIEISQSEAKYIIGHVKNHKMVIASRNKRKGGKTYFVMVSDRESVNCLLKLRKLKTKHELFNKKEV